MSVRLWGVVTSAAGHVAVLAVLGGGRPTTRPRPVATSDLRAVELIELPEPPAAEEVREEVLEEVREDVPEVAEDVPPDAAEDAQPPAPPKATPRSVPPPPPSPPPPAVANPTVPSAPAVNPSASQPTAADPPDPQPQSQAPRRLRTQLTNAKSAARRPSPPAKPSPADGCAAAPSKPKPTNKVPIVYPDAGRAAKYVGRLVLRAHVDAKGRVTKVDVLKPVDPAVDGPAKETFARWQFTPAVACGKPVASTFTIARDYGG